MTNIRIIRLDQSRAHRILWLLELLGLDYDIKIYLRHPTTWRAPPELLKIHPSGKSPILEIIPGDGLEPIQLAESGFMIQYLLKNYDPEHLLMPADPKQQFQVDYYLHYSEGTLQHILISMLINSVAKHIAPMGTKSFVRMVTKGINNGYYTHEWKLNMQYLDDQLAKEDTGYFVGDRLSAADIILTFPIYENVFDNEEQIKEITGEKGDLYRQYPRLATWCNKIRNDPLYIKISKLMEKNVNEHIRSKSKKSMK